MAQPTSIAGKVVVTLCLLLFGMVMGAVGIFGGLAQLHEQARNWTAARSYVPVPAQVESAYLDSQRSDFSDNIGDFQHRVHGELRGALERGESVTLWVDPRAPASAVYDKTIRPGMVAIQLAFGILFPSVGLGCLYMVVHILRAGHRKPVAARWCGRAAMVTTLCCAPRCT